MISKCDLTLKSVVDGSETLFYAEGRLEYTEQETKLIYHEEGATFCLLFSNGKAQIERTGDYALRLKLLPGEITQGEIGINGNVGELEIRTHCVEVDLSDDKLCVKLRYDILLGDGAQEMELFIQGNIKE